MPELRLLTLDAAAFADRHAVARAIAGHEPDVAVVHGAPSLLRWRSTCAAVAREAGLVVVGGGRPTGGTLVLSDLGVDVEAQQEHVIGSALAPRPTGLFVASLRRLGGPFVIAAGRVPPAMAGLAGLQHVVSGIDVTAPPQVVALAGRDVTADERLAPRSRPVTGGVLVELTLTEVPA